MSKLIDKFGREITVVRTAGRTKISWEGATLSVDREISDDEIISRASTHYPSASLVPDRSPSYREIRADAYFSTLKVEETDDKLTVVGDTLDKVITQLETIRVATGAPATPEWTDLISKLVSVKAAVPKTELKRPVKR